MAETKIVPDSRGRHALLALLDSETQESLAVRLDIPQGTVSQIKNQLRKPGREIAAKLTRARISFAWWDEPPTKAQIATDRARQAKGAA